mgnify:CR=1 FL=1
MLDQKMARVTGRQVPTPFTSGGAQVLGLIINSLPTDSADEALFHNAAIEPIGATNRKSKIKFNF